MSNGRNDSRPHHKASHDKSENFRRQLLPHDVEDVSCLELAIGKRPVERPRPILQCGWRPDAAIVASDQWMAHTFDIGQRLPESERRARRCRDETPTVMSCRPAHQFDCVERVTGRARTPEATSMSSQAMFVASRGRC